MKIKIEDVKFGSKGRDRITGAKGVVSCKLEREDGTWSICLEGLDSSGREYHVWTESTRLELDAT